MNGDFSFYPRIKGYRRQAGYLDSDDSSSLVFGLWHPGVGQTQHTTSSFMSLATSTAPFFLQSWSVTRASTLSMALPHVGHLAAVILISSISIPFTGKFCSKPGLFSGFCPLYQISTSLRGALPFHLVSGKGPEATSPCSRQKSNGEIASSFFGKDSQ